MGMTTITYEIYNADGTYRQTATVDVRSPAGSYLWDRLTSTNVPKPIPELGIIVTKIEVNHD